MRNTTENKKRGAMAAAAVCIVFLALFIVFLITAVVSEGELAAAAIVGIYAVILAAMIAGIGFALRQRMREIDSGEEEDAKQY